MVTGPWEVSEVKDLLLVRGCSWHCQDSGGGGRGGRAEVESDHGQYLNLVHPRASGSGGAFSLLHTCLLSLWDSNIWLVRLSVWCLFNQVYLGILEKAGKSYPKLIWQQRQIICPWIFKAFFFSAEASYMRKCKFVYSLKISKWQFMQIKWMRFPNVKPRDFMILTTF